MNGRPFHAPLSKPKRVLDVGCGTGAMTTLLGATYSDAEAIGIDIAPVPEGRHEKLANVEYVQGDILDLIGKDPRFELGSFDYIFQRLLMFGICGWPDHIAELTTLLKPGGWLESQEPNVNLLSPTEETVGDSMLWYRAFKEDAIALGQDIEVGPRLAQLFQDTPGMGNVQENVYAFAPYPDATKPDIVPFQQNLPLLMTMVTKKVCGDARTPEEAEKVVEDVKLTWDRGFNQGDHFNLYAVVGQKKG